MAEFGVLDITTYRALAPVLILAGTALLLFLVDSIDTETTAHELIAGTAVGGTVISLAFSVWYLLEGVGETPFLLFDSALVVDEMALFITFVVLSVTSLVLIASYDYVDEMAHRGEYYSLVLLAATGMLTMASANSLVTVFIAFELASLPSYALVAYLKHNRGSVEAGLKYFLIGAVSSAVFLYGISLVYAATGSLLIPEIAGSLDTVLDQGILGIGILLMVAGVAYKTASVPFHYWAPEAYEGAPAPISAFLSSASKAAGFVIAFRIFVDAFPVATMANLNVEWIVVFQVLAVLTMVLGNLAAAVQTKVKRMLAYSSVGHAGYALIGLAALSSTGGANELVLGGAMLHLLVYGFMNTGAFLFLAMTERWEIGRDFEDFNGLATQAPIASVAMSVFLINLAGLPLGGGFWSKYVLFAGAVNNGFVWLAAVGAGASALSLYYYSKLLKAMWIEEPADDLAIPDAPMGMYVAVVGAAVVTVGLLGAFGPVADIAVNAAAALLA
ncbi:NADH-quinone oxidoreductase subunit N [Natronoarchaeum sp. GCM10025703]|uniref:NADH-quinone oxidoreductase subunit N n=1 Tax=unclassified Natronoarchaeum TaxID=2620183 RepID=UPI00360A1CBA